MALDDRRMHRRLEDRVLALALGLRRVHRDVGIAEQVVRAIPFVATGGDADAGADRELLAFDRHGHLEGLEEPLANRQGPVQVGHVVEQDRELVAAQSRRHVA